MIFTQINLLSALDALEKFTDIFRMISFAVLAVLAVASFIKKRKKGIGNWRYEIGTTIAQLSLLGLMFIMPYSPAGVLAVDIMFFASLVFESLYN